MKRVQDLSEQSQRVDLIISMAGFQGDDTMPSTYETILVMFKVCKDKQEFASWVAKEFAITDQHILRWYSELTSDKALAYLGVED